MKEHNEWMLDPSFLEQGWNQDPRSISAEERSKDVGRRVVHLGVASLLVAATVYAGGGGSSSLHSLDGASTTGNASTAIYTDSPGPNAELSLSKGALGLSTQANVDALATGRNSAVNIISNIPGYNMSSEFIRYQFSVDRAAVDDFQGIITDSLGNPLFITKTFEDEFASNDQAADILDNMGSGAIRGNFLQVDEEKLELKGVGGTTQQSIDNIDGFMSTGSLGGEPDSDGDGDLDRPIYFSVDAQTVGKLPSTIYVKMPTGGAPSVYATAADLGLDAIGDDIDALSVYDATGNGVFDAGDGVVFSLKRGSVSLPMDVGVLTGEDAVTEGGIFLALPSLGVVEALPAEFFALQKDDELDAIHVTDPREMPDFLDPITGELGLGVSAQPIRAMESLVAAPSLLELEPSSTSFGEVRIFLNDTLRNPDRGRVESFWVEATVEDPTVATVLLGESVWMDPLGTSHSYGCGYSGTSNCDGDAGYFAAEGIGIDGSYSTYGGPWPLEGPNHGLGCFRIRGLQPGVTKVTITGWVMYPGDAWGTWTELSNDVIQVSVGGGSDAPVSVFGVCDGHSAPCGNASSGLTGCVNSTGLGGSLQASGTVSLAADDLEFEVAQLPVDKPVLLFVGINQVNDGLGAPFGNGLRCAGGQVQRLGVRFIDSEGRAAWGPNLGASSWSPAPTPGDKRYFQAWYRDPADSGCGAPFNLTNGYAVTFQL